MTANEYQKLALQTEQGRENQRFFNSRLVNGLMGLNGEAGECIDILKKHLYQEHWLDLDHLAHELGDVAWYLALSADAIGYSLDEIFELNIRKLKNRYPDGFDPARSIERREDDL